MRRAPEDYEVESATPDSPVDSPAESAVYLPEFLSEWRENIPTTEMFWRMVTLAGPTILANVLWFLQQTTTQSFIGRRIGEVALGQFAVGISIYNVAGLSLGIGLASALDTLASQAYGRSKRNPEIGELLQRSVIIDLVVSLPLVVMFLHLEPLLVVVYGQELGVGAASVLRASWLYLPLNIINNSITKTLQAQNLPQLQMYGSVAALVVCFLGNHFFVFDSITEAVGVLTVTHITLMTALVVSCIYHPDSAMKFARWPFAENLFDKQAFLEYLRIGLPSLLSLCAEWWAFEVLIVLAAQVSELEVTMLSVCLSTTGLCFSVALGISVAGSVCIGNALGANEPAAAKSYALLTLVVDQVFTICTSLCILLGRKVIASCFSSDLVVIDTFSSIAILVALFHWGDSLQFTFQGIFRGAGKQGPAARAVLLSLWLVGVPLSFYIGVYHKMGTFGILIGLIGGFCVEVPLMLREMKAWNWVSMALIASRCLDVEEVVTTPINALECDDDTNNEELTSLKPHISPSA